MVNAGIAEMTGKIMVVAIIVLFLIVVFVIFLHLYAKWFWWQTHQQQNAAERDNSQRPRRHRFVFTPEPHPEQMHEKLGLDPSLLKSMPVLEFSRPSDGEVQDCVVCLCQLVQGDKVRMLLKCNHVFHVECIDMWFQSHSTCPLCRNTLNKPDHRQTVSVADGSSSNVVEHEMTMAIQSRNASESSSTVSLYEMMSLENEERKSVVVPIGLGALKRMLSRDQKAIMSASSSSLADLEQGMN